MSSIKNNLTSVLADLPNDVVLVAVSKTKPVEDIMQAYEVGQRVFGENYIQELCDKYEQLPKDIEWHMIGHLQSNKVKYIAPFVALIHGVDSEKLFEEINKRGIQNNRKIPVLLQIHIAQEETKFGFDEQELHQFLDKLKDKNLEGITISGLMGMATFTDSTDQIDAEFKKLNSIFTSTKQKYFSDSTSFNILSMGMSGDYKMAIENGSTMVRVGSLIFGRRAERE